MKHAVVRTDNMAGTDVRALLVSVKFMGSGSTATAIDNGNVVVATELMEGEREVMKGVTPTAESKIETLALIASPEVMYYDNQRGLEQFENEAGAIARGYRFVHNATFGVTKEALAGAAEPAVGDFVEAAAGTKLNVKNGSATPGSTVIGKIIAIENAGLHKFYVVRVD